MAEPSRDASADAVELPSRLVFSLLQAAVRVAARVRIPLKRLQDLLRTAYFLEYRRRHPRDLSTVAEKLGVSLRTAGTLNRSLRDAFFSPETRVEPVRQITGAVLRSPRTEDDLVALTGLDPAEVRRTLKHLQEVGWVAEEDGRFRIDTSLRNFVTDDMLRRVDGVNHQLSVIADSVWARFVRKEEQTAGARTWSFAAREEDVAEAMEATIQMLRAKAIDMEETALEEGVTRRFAITVAFTPLDEEAP